MLTESITWRPLATGLPDAETNVLLTLAGDEPGTCEGFLDGEWEAGSQKGQPLFRDVTARALPAGEVTHWADMPKGAAGVAAVAPSEVSEAMKLAGVRELFLKDMEPKQEAWEEKIARVYIAMRDAGVTPMPSSGPDSIRVALPDDAPAWTDTDAVWARYWRKRAEHAECNAGVAIPQGAQHEDR